MAARTPGLIARCADVGDVQTAVRAAAATGLVTAVRCGGHSLAGFSTCDGGLVIDLSRMRQVFVDRKVRRGQLCRRLSARLDRYSPLKNTDLFFPQA